MAKGKGYSSDLGTKKNMFGNEAQEAKAQPPKSMGSVDKMKHEIFHDKMAKKLGC